MHSQTTLAGLPASELYNSVDRPIGLEKLESQTCFVWEKIRIHALRTMLQLFTFSRFRSLHIMLRS